LTRELFRELSHINLEKAWHGIHFLLTGQAWQLTQGAGEAILGGDPIGETLVYEPARLLTPDRVRVIADDLGRLDEATFRSRYDPAALTDAEIYPGGWGGSDLDYLMDHFRDLRSFFLTAADNGEAVLLATK
jgi:hypothetical protein